MGNFLNLGFHNISSVVPDTEIGMTIVKTGFGTPLFVISMFNIAQTGRGNIHVQSSNAFYPGTFSLNLTSSMQDLLHFVKFFRLSREFLANVALHTNITLIDISSTSTIASSASDDELVQLLPQYVVIDYHTAGSTRMGSAQDPMAVCDPASGLVYGTSNLYIADHSIFPNSIRAHPNAGIRELALLYAQRHLDDLL